MEPIARKKSAQYMIWALVILMMFVIIGLYGMPFLSANVDESVYVDDRNVFNSFELLGRVFDLDNFRLSSFLGEQDESYRSTESFQIVSSAFIFTYAAGIVYWLMLLPIAFCVINSVVLMIFKRGFSNIIPTAVLSVLGLISVLLFFTAQLQYNRFFEMSIPDYRANPYFYLSNTIIIFVMALIALGASVAHAVLVKKKVFERVPIYVKRVKEEDVLDVELLRAQQAKIDLDPLDFAKNAIFDKVVQIELKQRFKEVERLLGAPKFVDDNKTAYWWRNSDTMDEYLLRISAQRADRQICIEVDPEHRVKSVYYNADGTPYDQKTLKDKRLVGKKACYNADNFISELGTLSVEVLFADNSFIRKSDVKLEIGKSAEGYCTVKWHIDELEYEDAILVKEEQE